jgi:metal-responsive CopG/Arc/MetJ family transcriptional regulator
MTATKSEILSISVPVEMKDEFERLAERQGLGAGELFRDMVRLYGRYQEEAEFRRLQRYGARIVEGQGIDSEERLTRELYADR